MQYDNGGGQVSDDGQFLYAWDEKGRLTSATQKPTAIGTLHRVEYFYDGNNRMVGRRAESAMLSSLSDPPSGLTWSLETDPNLLTGVGLPAETTFVWDPISDTIVSVFDSSPSPTDPNGGLLKQIIHGGMAYDDPIEVTTVTPNSQTNLQRLYPVYDEAGDGTLQAVLNANGQLVARNLPADPYGADQLDVAGAAVDRVDVQATKDATGNVQSVDVTVHSTESLAAATVATGLRLATVDSNGGVVKTSTVTPAVVPNDAYAARFTLTAADWTALTDPAATSVAGLPAQALSVAVTNTLRAQAWSADTPILPAPNWAKASGSTFSSSTFPVEVRDSLSGVTSFIAGIASSASDTRVLYHVDNLALLGSTSSGTGSAIEDTLAARFQAQPFSDPFTGKNYVRERWYDPVTGTWLSPDRMGYRDSSNLYSFAAGDPVNGRDPTGDICEQRKGEGWWDWTKRCTQDVVWVADAFSEGVQAPQNIGKNIQRAAGGVVSTAKLAGGAVRTLVWDLPTASFNDAAADRLVAMGQSIGRFASHPLDTTVNAHKEMVENILQHEHKGEYVASGETAASQMQTDFMVAYSAYALGAAAYRAIPSVPFEGNPMAVDRLAETYDMMQGGGAGSGAPSAPPAAAPIITVIGRLNDLKNLEPGERSLLDRLPDQGNPKANWRQNSGVLRQELNRDLPIGDKSPGDTLGVFLNAERYLMKIRGWSYDQATGRWTKTK